MSQSSERNLILRPFANIGDLTLIYAAENMVCCNAVAKGIVWESL
jgi:hypothetical protein